MMADDWITHHGRGMPDLPLDAEVHLRLRDGTEDTALDLPDTVRFYASGIENWWVHQGAWFDITHYRIARPAAPTLSNPALTARDVGSVIEMGYANRLMPPEGGENDQGQTP